jgi:hypothetical protein
MSFQQRLESIKQKAKQSVQKSSAGVKALPSATEDRDAFIEQSTARISPLSEIKLVQNSVYWESFCDEAYMELEERLQKLENGVDQDRLPSTNQEDETGNTLRKLDEIGKTLMKQMIVYKSPWGQDCFTIGKKKQYVSMFAHDSILFSLSHSLCIRCI